MSRVLKMGGDFCIICLHTIFLRIYFLFSESIFVKCVSLRVAAASILWERMLMLNAMHIGD